MLLKDCMVAKAQIGDLSEQNISSTEELKGYVSRAPVASASNKVYKIRVAFWLSHARSHGNSKTGFV
jgi:hypothetical protein